MSTDNPFPPSPPQPFLSREEVIAYLVDMQAHGWTVYSESDSFILVIDEVQKLTIRPIERGFRIEHQSTVGRSLVGSNAFNLRQFQSALEWYIGNQRPTRIRTIEGKPASNFSRIANLIGSSRVEAVYDPYLDNKGIANLLTLVGLANSVIPGLRLITAITEPGRLSRNFVRDYFRELGCHSGEIRKTSSKKPHRRFMLLSGGQALIMGMSLNDLDKNEAVRLEDDQEDKPFFEIEWAAGQLLFRA